MAVSSTQATSSSSSLASSTPQGKYDVFLSFRGEDTRNSFTDHLNVALKQKGIITFRDDEKLEIGKSISLELLKAIEESRFAIVILSINYASSTWCLDELVKIVGCMKEMKMIVLPIFYDVDPSDVRKQMGTFAQAFAKHEEYFKDYSEKVRTWRAALREVANLKGWHVQDRLESQIIQNIVGELWHKLSSDFSENTKDLVGIISRGEKLESCLDLGSNDVRIIGIWGMGGIGKTTLARVVFRKVSNKFEGCCFLANVREFFEKGELVRLQQELIHQILNESMITQNVDDLLFVIQNRFRYKRIFLVLDDVNQLDQLNKLAGKHDWFGPGSRVIITTRNKHLLQTLQVDEIYEAYGLDDDESLRLLSLKAFKKDHPPKDYLKLSKAFVHYANGLPLAMEVLGSFLFGRSIDCWKSELNKLKDFPKREIIQVLEIGFDVLDKAEKDIFLHIACFFNNEGINDVVEILHFLDLYPDIGLGVLVEKSLIKVVDGTLWMHDLLQEMGRNIVRREYPNEPEKHSRLWLFAEINNVLEEDMGTKAIEGIVLRLYEAKEVDWNPESFSNIRNLQLLILDNVQVLHDLMYLPNRLRFLDWRGYPSKSFPSSSQPKSFQLLKFVQLKESLKLIETSNFSKIPNLEKLILEGCINLRALHQSIGDHKKLTLLNLKGCIDLRSLPNKFEMDSLETLILSGCSNLRRIPEFGEDMKSVLQIDLDGTVITKLPTSIGNLTGLKSLNVKDCKNLKSLPSTFFNMKSLQSLDFSGCSKLLENFGIAASVEELDVSGKQMASSNALFETLKKKAFSGFELLPFYSMLRNPNPTGLLLTSLLGLCSLTSLNLSYCNLNAIPNDICKLSSLIYLNLSGNHFVCLPESTSQLSSLYTLIVDNCKSLRSLLKLPLSISYISGLRCTSLETVPDLLRPNSSNQPELWISDCSKLDDNQGLIDLFFAAIRNDLQEHCTWVYQIIIPGSEIPEWFSHQNTGDEVEVNIKEPSLLCNEWMGIAVCVAFCPQYNNEGELFCKLIINGKKMSSLPGIAGRIVVLSDNIWLLYLTPQLYDGEDKNLLRECDANGFSQIGIKIPETYGFKVKKCGFRLVYKRDAEDLNQFMAQRGNSGITPYESFDVPQNNFGISTVIVERNKAKGNCDDYDGAGSSGEGSSKRIEGLTKLMTHGIADWEESSEYEESREELSDWQNSSESDLED